MLRTNAGKFHVLLPYQYDWEVIHKKILIPEELRHFYEDIYINNNGEWLRGVHIFHISAREPTYTIVVFKDKAKHVDEITKTYVREFAWGKNAPKNYGPCYNTHHNIEWFVGYVHAP